jgi:hypothetical protein
VGLVGGGLPPYPTPTACVRSFTLRLDVVAGRTGSCQRFEAVIVPAGEVMDFDRSDRAPWVAELADTTVTGQHSGPDRTPVGRQTFTPIARCPRLATMLGTRLQSRASMHAADLPGACHQRGPETTNATSGQGHR